MNPDTLDLGVLAPLLDLVPEKYRALALLALVWLPFITRAVHAYRTGSGASGAVSGVFLGTNAPKTKAPGEVRNDRGFRVPAIALFAALALGTGCAMNRPVFTETALDGTRRELRVTSFALWPATQDMARQKATLGKTFSLGTDGLGQEGGGTNVVAALRELNSILGKVAP